MVQRDGEQWWCCHQGRGDRLKPRHVAMRTACGAVSVVQVARIQPGMEAVHVVQQLL